MGTGEGLPGSDAVSLLYLHAKLQQQGSGSWVCVLAAETLLLECRWSFGSWSSEPCYCEQDLNFCRCAGNSPKHLVSVAGQRNSWLLYLGARQ